MTSGLPSLRDLQRAVGQALQHGVDDELPIAVEDGPARLGIHRNTAIGTLVAALRLSYPAVHALVGAEFFEGAARRFMEVSPPRSAWLDTYGAAFPAFLESLPEAASLPYLPDTARLEWAVGTALHAPDTTPLDLASVARLAEASPEDACFSPDPAAQLLRSAFPVDAVWRAVLSRDDDALAAIDLHAGPVWLLVRRTAAGIDVERLSERQWRFTASLFAGHPLHAAMTDADAPDASAWLATLLGSGCFTAIGPGARPSD